MFPDSKERSKRKAENLTAIFKQTLYNLWDTRRLTARYASTACYRGLFAFLNGTSVTSMLSKETAERTRTV